MSENKKNRGVREILLMGVFWRILFIEAVLLVFSLFYRWFTQDTTPMDLFWYGVRIVILVGIIILFMMVSLKKFLAYRIISPLELIAKANKKIQGDMTNAEHIELPDDSPHEIKTIMTSRTKMLKTIFEVSEERLRLVNFVRETFGRYISSKVVDEILESPEGQKIGGRRKTVTVLMSDLRGFTSLSETKDPEEMVQLLNRYLEQMSKIILKYDGIIDEIIGDAVLAVFGALETRKDDPERAIACAIEMQNSLEDLNEEIIQSGYPRLEMGIGINTGNVIVGNIGSQLRMKYGIVGSTVNTAARIESNSIGGQVLIGKSTQKHVSKKISAEPPKNIMMKGLKKPLVFYSVSAINSKFQVSLKTSIASNSHFSIKLPFQLWTVNGKKIDLIPRVGETIRLDDNTIDAFIKPILEPFTDIKLKFDFCIEAHCFEEIYAKNLSIESGQGQKFNRLKITSMDQKDRDILKKWMNQSNN
ncbi:MAG: adenylate/guanylate cyclase domain-containing protein [Desulfobacteraceae bacterium]|nr:adenylate/guanylate cyclase domain-containing protein [Desulfobacteraceae bacterium]